MPTYFDPHRFQDAAARFVAFFRELEQVFVERDDLLTQIALGLLGREHVLITGPPGTAKSQIAAAVLRRVIDERTGAPSVYTRQFTESTVQTDLVGPLDFKTLMDTGRTEHFTDEGLLGSVHAFLDEVFDGRDMLLRSTLNLLHERELKHGSKVTEGSIECAVMTSNRYLAEILEGSRETLLAFVDRIAFVSFVPKGFANPRNLGRVLRRVFAASEGNATRLSAPLSVGDLDVLQAAADEVVVPDLICETLAQLLELLEAETAAATRADPSFLPTRYLSTRTAVRAGRVLRAICVYDKLFANPDRPLEVLSRDFAQLRLHLILAGLGAEQAGQILAREMDPRERRQLQILRTEREIFDRCVAKLPPVPPSPRPARPAVQRLEERMTPERLRELGAPELLKAARELAAATMAGTPAAAQTAMKFREVAAALGERALQAGLGARAGDAPEAAAREMEQLAASLEEATPSLRPLARWLRGRALWLLDRTASPSVVSEEAAVLAVADASPGELMTAAETRLATLERLAALRRELVAGGAEEPAGGGDERARAGRSAEDELALLLDGVFRAEVAAIIDGAPDAGPREVLARLTPALAQIDGLGERLEALGGPRGGLRARVAARRLRPLVHAVFPASVAAGERDAFVESIAGLVAQLRAAGLEAVLPPADLLAWSAQALVSGAEAEAAPRAFDATQSGFRELREQLGPPLLDTLVAVLTRRIWLDPERPAEQPAEMTLGVRKLLGELPDELRDGLCAVDVERARQTLAFLERWWRELGAGGTRGLSQSEVVTRVEQVVMSGFLRVVRDEAAPARAAAGVRQLADVFPSAEGIAAEMATRAAELERTSTAHLVDLLTRRADEAWGQLLGRKA